MNKFSIFIALVLGSLQLAAQTQPEQAIQALVNELEMLNANKKNISVMPVRANLNGKASFMLEEFALAEVEQALRKSKVYKPVSTAPISTELEDKRWLKPESYAAYDRINKLNFAFGSDVTSSFLLLSFKPGETDVYLEGMWIPGGVVSNAKKVGVEFQKDAHWYKLIGEEVPMALLDEPASEEPLQVMETKNVMATIEDIEPDMGSLPQTRIMGDLSVTLLSAEVQSSSLIFDFSVTHLNVDKKLPRVYARLVDADGKEHHAKKDDLSYRNLIGDVTLRTEISFDKEAALAGEVQVLELNFSSWGEKMQFKNITLTPQGHYSEHLSR
jgi:hypothetical protein